MTSGKNEQTILLLYSCGNSMYIFFRAAEACTIEIHVVKIYQNTIGPASSYGMVSANARHRIRCVPILHMGMLEVVATFTDTEVHFKFTAAEESSQVLLYYHHVERFPKNPLWGSMAVI